MIYVLGGGVGTQYACIGVTYPSGSTCTCTNGTKTLKAKDTSGTTIFNVPSTGTWTVTATNGDKTASKSVSITAEGQTVSVTLAYEFYIFQAGTGAVQTLTNNAAANGSISISNSYITTDFSDSSDGESGFWTKNKINTSAYTKLYFDLAVTEIDPQEETDYRRNYGLYSTASIIANSGNVAVTTPSATFSRKTIIIDITNCNSSYYIGSRGIGGATIYNIWLY